MFNTKDIEHCDNLIRALKKATYTLEGMEVLAMADVFKWVNTLRVKIDADIAASAALASVEEVKDPISATDIVA